MNKTKASHLHKRLVKQAKDALELLRSWPHGICDQVLVDDLKHSLDSNDTERIAKALSSIDELIASQGLKAVNQVQSIVKQLTTDQKP